MFPTMLLSAAVTLTPQPVLIPSDMLRNEPDKASSRRFNAPKGIEEAHLDNVLKSLEDELAKAKKAGSPQALLVRLQNMVDEYRERKARFDERAGRSEDDGPEKRKRD